MNRDRITTLGQVLGFILVTIGVWQISAAAGCIVAGVSLVFVCAWLGRPARIRYVAPGDL